MKKVYLVYAKIKEDDFLSRMRYLLYNKYAFKKNDTNDDYMGLYAWSTDKTIIDEFLSIRNNDIYIIKTKKMDYEEYDEFRRNYSTEKMKIYMYELLSIENKSTEIQIASTKNEYDTITMDGEENMFQWSPEFKTDYIIFNDEIIDALDIVAYTTVHDMNWSIYEDRADYASNMVSYGLTVNSHKYIPFYNNTAMMLMYIFKPMFV